MQWKLLISEMNYEWYGFLFQLYIKIKGFILQKHVWFWIKNLHYSRLLTFEEKNCYKQEYVSLSKKFCELMKVFVTNIFLQKGFIFRVQHSVKACKKKLYIRNTFSLNTGIPRYRLRDEWIPLFSYRYPDTWISYILNFFAYLDNWILGYDAYLDTQILGYMDIHFLWIHGYLDTLDIKNKALFCYLRLYLALWAF